MATINLYLDNRIIKTKRSLKYSLLVLLQQKKFDDISITNIVQHANINRGTFYNHYQNKKDLLIEVIDGIISDLIVAFRKPYQNMKPFVISDLSPSDIMLFNNVYKHSISYVSFVNSSILPEFENRLIREIKDVYLKELRVYNSKMNSEWIAGYFAYGIVGMILEWVREDFKYSTQYMNEQLLELMKIAPKQTFRINGYTRSQFKSLS